MKLSQSIGMLSTNKVEKKLSKKIAYANTSDKLAAGQDVRKKAQSSAAEPIYFTNSMNLNFNPDIRYQNNYGFSPLTHINYRNDLLIFAENYEIKKAVRILTNEIIVSQLQSNKYPVFPVINLSLVPEDKQETANAIQKYLDEIFYPKLYQMYNLKKDGLSDLVKEYLITGKKAYEIVYDSLKNPKDIIGMIPIDPSTLQKFKKDDLVWYVQKPLMDNNQKDRILHENQVVLIEWNKYDYGYVSYVDTLRRPFNVMRSMQTAKILWFAVKSQVRMHIKLALGDMARTDAIQKLSEARNNYTNQYAFSDETGQVMFNNSPLSTGYREFFTAETTNSGHPEIEEVTGNGPDLTETDSLQYFDRLFWNSSEIPYDRIDPNSSDAWGFTDVTSLRKVEVNFGKFIESIRNTIEEIFLKPIIIQLTLKEIEIGIDLSLLDTIRIEWVAFNQYEKLAELEVLNKKVEIANNLAAFGEQQDAFGNMRKTIPVKWIMDNYFDFTPEQKEAMKLARREENIELGYNPDGTMPDGMGEEDEMGDMKDEETEMMDVNFEEEPEETPEDIAVQDDVNW